MLQLDALYMGCLNKLLVIICMVAAAPNAETYNDFQKVLIPYQKKVCISCYVKNLEKIM